MPRGEIRDGSPLEDIDWAHVEEIIEDGWRCVAPKRLLAIVDDSAEGP